MSPRSIIMLLVVAGAASAAVSQALPPVAPVRPVTDIYFGTKVVDPYRYMENLQNPEVQAWMRAQNAYTRAVLASIPGRAKLLARIHHFDQSAPIVLATRLPGDIYLIQKWPAQGGAFNLYVRRSLAGEDRLLVNPAAVKLAAAGNQEKGANAVLAYAASPDNRYVAVRIARGGSERDAEIHVFEIGTGRQLDDVIRRAWGSTPSWLPDGRSLLYDRLQPLPPGTPRVEAEQKVRTYLHVLGSDPAADPAVFGYGVVPTIHVGPRDQVSVSASPGSRYVLGVIENGVARNSAFYLEPLTDLGKTNSDWCRVAGFSDDVSDVAIHGDDLYLLTYKNALHYKVLRTSSRHPDIATAETVVTPNQAVVTAIYPAADALYVQLLDGGVARLLRVPYGPRPRAQEVRLPFQGAIARAQTDPRQSGILLTMTSWTKSPAIYAYDPRTNSVTNTNLQPTGSYGSPGNLEDVDVKVASYDGTLVPLSIVYMKGLKRDGSHPTWLNGYGAYGIVNPPVFLPMLLAWYEQGGVFAQCHVRGGGEYGEAWHLAGKGATKPNTWRDFNACAEYLIRNHYTSPARLGGEGVSAGGILIGRAITSRPDLYAAAIDWVGVSDTLRMETTANGVPNIPEFGSVKTKAGFDALYDMSAYAHVKNGTKYPAVLVMTGANDPRVDPWQSEKIAARLQAATASGRPVLLRVNYAGGHGNLGGTKAAVERSIADIWTFLLWQFGVPGFQPAAQH